MSEASGATRPPAQDDGIFLTARLIKSVEKEIILCYFLVSNFVNIVITDCVGGDQPGDWVCVVIILVFEFEKKKENHYCIWTQSRVGVG